MVLKIITNDGLIEYIECNRFVVVPEEKLGNDVKEDCLQIGDARQEKRFQHIYIVIDDTVYSLYYVVCYVLNAKGQTIEKL